MQDDHSDKSDQTHTAGNTDNTVTHAEPAGRHTLPDWLCKQFAEPCQKYHDVACSLCARWHGARMHLPLVAHAPGDGSMQARIRGRLLQQPHILLQACLKTLKGSQTSFLQSLKHLHACTHPGRHTTGVVELWNLLEQHLSVLAFSLQQSLLQVLKHLRPCTHLVTHAHETMMSCTLHGLEGFAHQVPCGCNAVLYCMQALFIC